jgi:hypothetical protein
MRKIQLLFAFIGAFCMKSNAQAPGSTLYDDLFCPVDTAWAGDSLVVPAGTLHYSILLKEGDIAYNTDKGTNAAIKGGFGSVYYDRSIQEEDTVNNIRINKNKEGWLYMSLLDNKQSTLGDGGGLVRMRVKEQADKTWQVISHTDNGTTLNTRFFDMDAQGGTKDNNGLQLGYSNLSSIEDKGNIFMYDGWANSNTELSGLTNISDFTLPAGAPGAGTSIPRYKNMGWVVEINKGNGKPLRKLYNAGRADFGGMVVTSTKYTAPDTSELNGIIFTTQTQPAVILKYDPVSGNQISAFKQDTGSFNGSWIILNEMDVDGSLFPFTFNELSDIQKIALERGATMFNRLGDIVRVNDPVDFSTYYLIAETGADSSGDAFTNPARIYNGRLAHHLKLMAGADGNVKDPHGRILKLASDVAGDLCKPYLEGCVISDGRSAFSNPKHLQVFNFDFYTLSDEFKTRSYLMINEEVNSSKFKKNPVTAQAQQDLMNETYILNLEKQNPGLNDLRPFAIGPKGAEIQSVFSVEGMSALFMSIRYPNTANSQPYNKSMLIAVNNFEAYFSNPQGCTWNAPAPGCDTSAAPPPPTKTEDIIPSKNSFNVWPNPATRTLHFADEQKLIGLYDLNGRLLKQGTKTKAMDIFDITPGIYFLRNDKNQVKKVVIQK